MMTRVAARSGWLKPVALAAGMALLLTGTVIGPALAALGMNDDLLLDVIAVGVAGAGLFILLLSTPHQHEP